MGQLNFADYDFDNLVLQLQNRLKEKGSWKDTYRSSTGSMLIELFAAIANMVLYYVERRAEESYLLTAKNKSSIINLVRLLNYIPKRKVSAIGNLRFTLTGGAHSQIVFIPKYTKCTSDGGVDFVTKEDVVIMPGQTYVDVSAIQGNLINMEFISNGLGQQEFKITDDSVENTNLIVYTDGVEWTPVTSFFNSVTTSKHYVIKPELDDTMAIIFGDGVFGMIPVLGSTIAIKYIKSLGLEGNVYELDRITTLGSGIYDSLQTSMDIEVTNITTFLGGDDAESAEEIRNQAPQVFATGDRAVTRSDFKAIIKNFPGVVDVNVWGENEENPPNYDMYNQVKICPLLQNWGLPDVAFKTELINHLYTKSLLTIRYSFVEPTIINVIPVVDLKVIKGRSLTDTEFLVVQKIETQFVLGSTTKLDTDMRLSNIIKAIKEITDVSYCHVVLTIKKNLELNFSSDYEWGELLECTPIKSSTVKVYANDNLIAEDDGLGGFISSDSNNYLVSGLIDYETGEIGVNITPDVEAPISIFAIYQQEESGDIVTQKNQICKLDHIDIVNISYIS